MKGKQLLNACLSSMELAKQITLVIMKKKSSFPVSEFYRDSISFRMKSSKEASVSCRESVPSVYILASSLSHWKPCRVALSFGKKTIQFHNFFTSTFFFPCWLLMGCLDRLVLWLILRLVADELMLWLAADKLALWLAADELVLWLDAEMALRLAADRQGKE